VLAVLATACGEDLVALFLVQPLLDRAEHLRPRHVERDLALIAERPSKSLRNDAQQACGQEVRGDAQRQQAFDGPGGDWCVQGGKHQVPAIGRSNRRLGRHRIADLADHDDVRRLPQHASQEFGKFQPLAVIDLRLANPGQGVFDRVFDGIDLASLIVEPVKTGVERRGLARARRGLDVAAD